MRRPGWLALGLIALGLSGCTAMPSPTISSVPPATPSLTVVSGDVAPRFPIPEDYQCDQELILEWPVIDQAVPMPASAGSQVEIAGHGGAIRCGNSYDESSRDFDVFLGDELVGSLNCYVNHCEGVVTLPDDLAPGMSSLIIGPNAEFNLEIQ